MDTATLLSIIALAVIAAVIAVFLKESKLKTIALLVTLAAGVLIFIRLLPHLSGLVSAFSALAENSGVNGDYLLLLLKIIGVAYIAEFGAQLCRDAGEGTAALKVELAARVAILLLALPIIASIISSVLALLA